MSLINISYASDDIGASNFSNPDINFFILMEFSEEGALLDSELIFKCSSVIFCFQHSYSDRKNASKLRAYGTFEYCDVFVK